MQEDTLRRISYILFIILGAGLLFYLGAKHLFASLAPFFLGWLIANSLRGTVEFITKRSGVPRRAVSVAVVLLFFFAIGYLLYLFVTAVGNQAGELYRRMAGSGELTGKISDIILDLQGRLSHLPLASHFEILDLAGPGQRLQSAFFSVIERVLEYLMSAAGRLVGALPSALVFLFVCAVSSFYFCLDLEKINRSLMGFLPKSSRKVVLLFKNQLIFVLSGYVRAYFFIIVITFTQLFVGFKILGIPYALLLSLLIALVDILPLLGVGVVLLPWGALCVITGSTVMGVGLFVLYFVITVVRQIAEPRILGGTLGLHPLLALVSLYVGARLFGFFGIIWFPILVILIKNLYSELSGAREGSNV